MAHLSIQVLGEFEVSNGDETISSFESDKVRALLAYLVVEAGRSHRRETLVGLLWPDCSEQTARHNLSQALFNLRQVLGDHTANPPYLQITRDAVQFNRESDYSLDLEEFDARCSAWEKSRGQEKADITPLKDLVRLYRGKFLQEFYLKDSTEFEEWILVQRASVHQRVMDALTILADEFEKRGDFQSAQRYCRRQLKLDPWREEAHCHLMRLLAQDGQRSAALAQYEICRNLLAEEFGVEPSPQTRALYEQIRTNNIQLQIQPTAQFPTIRVQRLPLPGTPFLGRKEELAELAQMIATPERRCISLVGPGGIGKTRLALEVAEQNKNEFVHGAAFIPLVSVRSSQAAVSAIASGIDFAFYGQDDPKLQLLNYLGTKRMLIILDNVEHLLAGGSDQVPITDLTVEILRQAPQVKLLITSREALNVGEEWIYEIHGLDFPEIEGMETADKFSSMALFVQHARRVRPGFEMDGGNKVSLARLCRLVEGMPLAIELAATWVRILSIEEILVEIERNLNFLNAPMRDIPERHRSMRAVFDQSWQMLSLEEKHVLSRLSAFRGGFSRHAAEQVAGSSLMVLSSLVTRSLVRRAETSRYDLHELIRQFAASKLAEDAIEMTRIQEMHSLYYLGLLEEKDTSLHSHSQKAILKELTEEIHNLRESWDWAVKNQKIASLYRASTALRQLFEMRNWFREGELTFARTAEALQANRQAGQQDIDQEIARYAMLAHFSFFMFRQGKSAAAYAALTPCVEQLRKATLQTGADHLPLVFSLGYLGIVCWELGRFSEASERLQEGITFAQNFEQRWYEAHLNEFLGIVANDQGEYVRGRQYLSRALDIFRQFGDRIFTAHCLSYLGRTMHALEEYPEAEKLLRESLELAREMDYQFGSGLALDALGQAAYMQGNYSEAEKRFKESASLFKDMGDTHRLARTLNHQGVTALALNQTDEAQNAFRTALRLAHSGGLIPIALAAMAGMAALQVRQECNQQTLELVLFILQYAVTNQETQDLARGLQKELESALPAQAVEVAHRCAGQKDLNEVISQYITGT
jgi:DNA-binding SARP family transcriptional activator/predicted ATPase